MFSRESNNPWKKYSCLGKTDNEKLVDLFEATKDGKVDILRILITKGAVNVNATHKHEKEGQGLTALHLAVRHNHLDCMKLLIENGADINATDNFGFRPIHDAARYGYADCLRELVNNGAVIDGVKLHGLDYVTPLYYAIKCNSIECLQILEVKTKSFDIQECDRLIWLSGSSNDDTTLLPYAKKYTFTDSELKEWLKNSAVSGNVEYFKAVKELCNENGSDREFIRNQGSLVIVATQHGHHGYLENLLQGDFDSNKCNSNNSTALHYAARYGYADGVKLLAKHGAALNAKNLDNFAPIHIALKQNNFEAVSELIKCGCDIDLPGGDENDPPLHMALKVPVEPATLKEILAGKPSLLVKNDKEERAIDVVDKEGNLYQVLMEYIRN